MTPATDRKSTRLNSSHLVISYAVFCLKKKTRQLCLCKCYCFRCSGASIYHSFRQRSTFRRHIRFESFPRFVVKIRHIYFFFFFKERRPREFSFLPQRLSLKI